VTHDDDAEPDQQAGDGADTPRPGVPVTGEPAIDRLLSALEDLESRPLSEHHERLVHAHEQLQQLLNPDDGSGS
jgi:hypothetical protein